MLELYTYWKGRDQRYRGEWTAEIQQNGAETVRRIAWLTALYAEQTGRELKIWRSGWRPQAVNDATSNAASASKHLTAQAGDVEDLDRHFARWCLDNQTYLEVAGLWMEDPRWTPDWVHLQTLPPASRRRIYIPSSASAKCDWPPKLEDFV